jgi:hypothetical protein
MRSSRKSGGARTSPNVRAPVENTSTPPIVTPTEAPANKRDALEELVESERLHGGALVDSLGYHERLDAAERERSAQATSTILLLVESRVSNIVADLTGLLAVADFILENGSGLHVHETTLLRDTTILKSSVIFRAIRDLWEVERELWAGPLNGQHYPWDELRALTSDMSEWTATEADNGIPF